MAGIFADSAPDYLAHGIPVFPTGGPEGKKALVRNYQRMGVPASRKLLEGARFDGANLAFMCGQRNRITVLDVDTPDRTAFDRALAIAEREGDVGLQMRTLVAAADADIYDLNWDGSHEKGSRAIGLVGRVDDPRAEALAYFDVAIGHIVQGAPDLADEPVAASVAAAERLRHHFYLARSLFLQAILATLRGDWSAARECSGRALTVSPREPRHLFHLMLTEYETGNIGQGKALLERLLEVTRLTEPGATLEYGFTALASPWIALVTGENVGLDVAVDANKTVLSAGVYPLVAALARLGEALLAVHRKDVAAAERLYAGYKRTGVGGLFGCGDDRTLGLLARTIGRIDDAAGHFEDEMAFCRRVGYRPRLAWACSDYAEMLLERDDPGDREKATELQDEAIAIAQELGMQPLLERVLAQREILKA